MMLAEWVAGSCCAADGGVGCVRFVIIGGILGFL